MSRSKLEAVGREPRALKQALAELDEFRALTTSPLVGRDERGAGRRRGRGEAMKLDPHHRQLPRRARAATAGSASSAA